MAPHHYYFHNFGGYRYWHFYDGRSLHWYGFYFGPRFFWFPFYAGYWWWWDVALARWVFWWDGYWWWYGPGNVVYVYADGNYTPYEQAQAQAQENAGASEAGGEPAAPPTAPPSAPSAPPAAAASASAAPASEGSSWTSPDGRRMVQIVGANGAAYLYNVSPGGKNPGFMKYLGEGIEKVRFAGGAQTQILVEYKDDTFAVFDADGSLVSGSAKPKEKAPAPAAPASKT